MSAFSLTPSANAVQNAPRLNRFVITVKKTGQESPSHNVPELQVVHDTIKPDPEFPNFLRQKRRSTFHDVV